MSLADYYDASYPPELWETPAAPVAAARRSAPDEAGTVPAGTVPATPEAVQVPGTVEHLDDDAAAVLVAAGPLPELPADAYADDAQPLEPPAPADDVVRFQVSAGTPGSYDPAVPPAERPRNVTDLNERATPVLPYAWQPGQYVQIGERGKRAHWDGEAWRIGEAVPEQTRSRSRSTVPAGTVPRL